MELKVISEKINPLFKRKELIFHVKTDISPSKKDVMKTISEKYSAPADTIRVLDIKGRFGTREFTIRANIYPSKKERDTTEKLTNKEKIAEGEKIQEKKAEAAPAPAK